MKYFVITDSTDTQVGLRLAGIEGVVVREEPLVRAAIQTAAADPDIAVLLITEKLAALCAEAHRPAAPGGGDPRPAQRRPRPRLHHPLHPGGHWSQALTSSVRRLTMPDMNQKLDRFTAKILAEAADESKRALAEVKRRRELRLQEAEDAALKEAYEYIHGEVARIQSEAGRGVSRHMLENKRALYLRRTEMAQEVFALVRAKIAAFTRTPAYGQRLTALLAEALEQLSGAEEVLVTLRGDDLSFREALAASAPQIRLTFREGDFRLGGLIAESPDLGLRVDSSFDSAAGELSGHFAELFGLSLSDE